MLFVMDPQQVDTTAVDKQGETPKKLAARLGVATKDLIELNAIRFPSLNPSSKLKAGTELVVRDRSAEPEVFMPNKVELRTLDSSGSLAIALQRQERHGDPTTTGVVWPRVVELGLLAGASASPMRRCSLAPSSCFFVRFWIGVCLYRCALMWCFSCCFLVSWRICDAVRLCRCVRARVRVHRLLAHLSRMRLPGRARLRQDSGPTGA